MLFILEDDEDRRDLFTLCLESELPDLHYHIEETAPEAIAWLEQNHQNITLYSLDHDLYVPEYDGDAGDGRDVVFWIVQNASPRFTVIHTSNSRCGSSMINTMEENGWHCHWIVPYQDLYWITHNWIQKIKEFYQLSLTEGNS